MAFKWWIKLRLHVANNQIRMNSLMSLLSLIISLVVVIALILYHGFYFNHHTQYYIRLLIYGSLWFYIIKYWLLCFYSMNKWEYIKSSLFEFFVIVILILHFISVSVLPVEINFIDTDKFNRYYLLGIQLYFLIIAVMELSKSTSIYKQLNFFPPKLMLFSFLALIVLGTLLLMMPQMTYSGISFIDAMFTATSASCVTGLTTLSITSTFTFKGLIIIMILTQLGGMSILTFAVFFTTIIHKSGAGLCYQHLIKDLMASDRSSDSYSLLKNVIITTLSIEIAGVLLLYFYWKNSGSFRTNGDAFFYAIFHAVSAFNNAGFTLWNSNFMHSSMIHSYIPQFVIMFLVLSGGIGFFTLTDLFGPKSIRNRKKYPWKKLLSGTKIVLKTTFSLIIVGSFLFFIIEYNNSLSSHDTFFTKAFAALFQIIV
ncbi:MAG: hypothetical protein LBU51_07515, partial [Bacteroidales bacterium]|nr:hypothetical protein [Bacteroidales bacterium]